MLSTIAIIISDSDARCRWTSWILALSATLVIVALTSLLLALLRLRSPTGIAVTRAVNRAFIGLVIYFLVGSALPLVWGLPAFLLFKIIEFFLPAVRSLWVR